MKKIIILLVLLYSTNIKLFSQGKIESKNGNITLTKISTKTPKKLEDSFKGNEAYYMLEYKGKRGTTSDAVRQEKYFIGKFSYRYKSRGGHRTRTQNKKFSGLIHRHSSIAWKFHNRTYTFSDTFFFKKPLRSGAKYPAIFYLYLKRGYWGSDLGREYHKVRVRLKKFRFNRCNWYRVKDEKFGDMGIKYLRYRTSSFIKLKTPSNPMYLSSEGMLKIKIPNEFSSYTWKYRVGGVTKTIRGQGTNFLNIKGKSFLSPNDYGKTIAVWVESRCAKSNSISFTYLPDAPEIKKAEESGAVCKGGKGSVKIYFKRGLYQSIRDIKGKEVLKDELLGVNLVKDGKVKYSIILGGTRKPIKRMNKENNGLYSYTFTNITPGTYKITVPAGSFGIPGRGGKRIASVRKEPNITSIINEPSLVTFTAEGTNSSCNDGDQDDNNNNDGKIAINAEGGSAGVYQYSITNGVTWLPFPENKNSVTVTDLKPDDYKVKVRKLVSGGNYCDGFMRDKTNETTMNVTIEEPVEPLKVEKVYHKEPTAYGFKDGEITYKIIGGTPFEDGSYKYIWKNSNGDVLTSVHEEVLTETINDKTTFIGYSITLHSTGKGIYNLEVTDKNYEVASYKQGCFQKNNSFTLDQPDPITVSFSVEKPISCNIDNQYNDGIDDIRPFDIADQFQDGILTAHVSGGVVYTKGDKNGPKNKNREPLPYLYTWKKKVGENWVSIHVNDSIIKNRSVGTYAVNVQDKNGIVLGNYNLSKNAKGEIHYELGKAIDSTFYLEQPEKLAVTFKKTVASCFSGADGTAEALVSGGIPPYLYEWSNGATSSSVQNLKTGKHKVYVTDSKGCQVQGVVFINQPKGLKIAPEVKTPTCFKGNDGSIKVTVTGGNPPYTYKWSTGKTTKDVLNLASGSYELEVIDSKGCKTFYTHKIEDPERIQIDLDQNYFLCKDQTVALDVAIEDANATYKWTSDNGFTSNNSNVVLSKTGVYTVTITNKFGCVREEKINLEASNTPIDARYLLVSQAYANQEVNLINVSSPMGDKVEWFIPESAEVISKNKDNLILMFEEEGTYTINLKSNVGKCRKEFSKKIIVHPATEVSENDNENQKFIKEFSIYPNPNDRGEFKVRILLEDNSDISVKILDLSSGSVLHERNENSGKEFLLEYTQPLSSGVYLMLLETRQKSALRKIIFK